MHTGVLELLGLCVFNCHKLFRIPLSMGMYRGVGGRGEEERGRERNGERGTETESDRDRKRQTER